MSKGEMTVSAAQNSESAVSPNNIFDQDIPDHLKQWFPMRIAHGRPERTMAIKAFLDEHQVQNFLPLSYQNVPVNPKPKVEAADYERSKVRHKVKTKRVLLPAINNLIFVRSTEERLTFMKRFHGQLMPLRYMMWRAQNGLPGAIIRVPDYQMENFMRVASVADDRVMYLGDKDFSKKIGTRIRVVDGPFKGVEGTVCRVKKDRRVVVSLQGVASVAISYISPALLEEI